MNLPIGLLALSIAWSSLPQTARSGHGFDRVAAGLNVITFAALIFARARARSMRRCTGRWRRWRYSRWRSRCCCRERGHPAPMLPVDLFRRPLFALSTVTAICSFAAQGTAFVSLPFYFQTVLGRSRWRPAS